MPRARARRRHNDITPFPATGEQLGGSAVEIIEGAPHGCQATHPLRFNRTLLQFLANG
ncbi:hypothetical protein ACTWPT_56005 [Nonomuraea sp. 3N208]|uniref:hypothetical protein n=1 Tax=Nonomuraea sp. 3N208 TaxID=3457421 RepID=UPI003FD1EC89